MEFCWSSAVGTLTPEEKVQDLCRSRSLRLFQPHVKKRLGLVTSSSSRNTNSCVRCVFNAHEVEHEVLCILKSTIIASGYADLTCCRVGYRKHKEAIWKRQTRLLQSGEHEAKINCTGMSRSMFQRRSPLQRFFGHRWNCVSLITFSSQVVN